MRVWQWWRTNRGPFLYCFAAAFASFEVSRFELSVAFAARSVGLGFQIFVCALVFFPLSCSR